MLIEILIALAIFGFAAVYLVESAFVASRTIRLMKDTRELDQKLLWAQSQILKLKYAELEEGGDFPLPDSKDCPIDEVEWEVEVEPFKVVHLYRVHLTLRHEGNEKKNIEPGERKFKPIVYRENWSRESDFVTDVARIKEESKEKYRNHLDSFKNP